MMLSETKTALLGGVREICKGIFLCHNVCVTSYYI